MKKREIEILEDFINNENTVYCYDWQCFDYEVILPLIDKCLKENKSLQQRYNHLLEIHNICAELEQEKTQRIYKVIKWIDGYEITDQIDYDIKGTLTEVIKPMLLRGEDNE